MAVEVIRDALAWSSVINYALRIFLVWLTIGYIGFMENGSHCQQKHLL